jgi:hypothetical protein
MVPPLKSSRNVTNEKTYPVCMIYIHWWWGWALIVLCGSVQLVAAATIKKM